MTDKPRPRTSFDWTMYADATLAGLATLIPLPFVDDLFESFFRRRMPAAIARSRGSALPPAAVAALRADRRRSLLQSCLLLPVTLTIGLLRRLSRKLLYFLTIKAASEKLSYYWHRAFLLDYMLAAGHAETEASIAAARQAMDEVLSNTSSPLIQLASQVVAGMGHVWRSLRLARRGTEDAEIQGARAQMARRWNDFAGYFEDVAARYERRYQQVLAERAHESSAGGV
jgi:hypothetical protein